MKPGLKIPEMSIFRGVELTAVLYSVVIILELLEHSILFLFSFEPQNVIWYRQK